MRIRDRRRYFFEINEFLLRIRASAIFLGQKILAAQKKTNPATINSAQGHPCGGFLSRALYISRRTAVCGGRRRRASMKTGRCGSAMPLIALSHLRSGSLRGAGGRILVGVSARTRFAGGHFFFLGMVWSPSREHDRHEPDTKVPRHSCVFARTYIVCTIPAVAGCVKHTRGAHKSKSVQLFPYKFPRLRVPWVWETPRSRKIDD